MVISSQEVYKRLLSRSKNKRALLSFDTLALCCVQEDGEMDLDKLKKLIRLLRPDRDGTSDLVRITVPISTLTDSTVL